jgi:hypothetical protein
LDDGILGSFLESRRNIATYVCPLTEALGVVEALFKDPSYRSLSVEFVGYSDADLPLVRIEAVFAVKL